MKRKVIFELKINSKYSIMAVEKSKYGSCYYDSLLYLKTPFRKIIIEDCSFCEGFGLDMYYRMYNLKEYTEPYDLAKAIEISWANIDYESKEIFKKVQKNDAEYKYYFAGGIKLSLYLFKKDTEYSLTLIKWWEIGNTGRYKAKTIKDFNLNESMIDEWKKIISYEWEKRRRSEGEKHSKIYQTDEKWEEFFKYMRSD